jgi:hypothetical protein
MGVKRSEDDLSPSLRGELRGFAGYLGGPGNAALADLHQLGGFLSVKMPIGILIFPVSAMRKPLKTVCHHRPLGLSGLVEG